MTIEEVSDSDTLAYYATKLIAVSKTFMI
jgi:hypothetical protein